MPSHPNNRAPHLMRGDTANIRTLSARYIADLQDHWEIHGRAALDEYREKFVDRYAENFSLLPRVIRVEADVKRSMATPKTVDEALAELESRVGTKGRRKFEKFLREVAKMRMRGISARGLNTSKRQLCGQALSHAAYRNKPAAFGPCLKGHTS